MMQKTRFNKLLSLILCMVLIAAMTLFAGCGDKKQNADNSNSGIVSQEGNVLGEGKTEFTFTVVDGEGKETTFTIHTDKKTVGEALVDVNLIAGETSEYGLYVKTVNGITVDYDTDGKYWAFYVNGEYAMTGVDSTEITEGATYSFKVE